MVKITLMGYAADNPRRQDPTPDPSLPEIIKKEVDVPAVPRIGEEIWFESSGTIVIDAVWHMISESGIQVHFSVFQEVLQGLVEDDGFSVEG